MRKDLTVVLAAAVTGSLAAAGVRIEAEADDGSTALLVLAGEKPEDIEAGATLTISTGTAKKGD